MNPVLFLIICLVAVVLWFLLSFAFRPIGRLVCQIWKDAVDEINKNDESEEEEDEER